MRKFTLNKLVKDSVYESMVELGQRPEHRVLEDDRWVKYYESDPERFPPVT